MNNLLITLAISVMVIGFLVLVGVALWLAAERRRNQPAVRQQPVRQTGSQPAGQQSTNPHEPGAQGQPAAAPPAAPGGQASGAAPTETRQHKDANSSGEYPSAALYDQTLLPEPRKRRTRPSSK
jgi:predicted lipid-binding transport protein (Tim44 family)